MHVHIVHFMHFDFGNVRKKFCNRLSEVTCILSLQVHTFADFKAALDARKCILAPWAPDSKIEGDVKKATTIAGAVMLLTFMQLLV
jgi:hypothetical protein